MHPYTIKVASLPRLFTCTSKVYLLFTSHTPPWLNLHTCILKAFRGTKNCTCAHLGISNTYTYTEISHITILVSATTQRSYSVNRELCKTPCSFILLFFFIFNFVVLRSYLSLDHLPYASGTCLLHFLMETACKFNVLNSIFFYTKY